MIYCHRCGAELKPGSLKFLVTIHVTADFDGVLPAEGDMEDLESFMRRIDSADAESLESDVYQSQGYVLCPACKTAFAGDPFGQRPGNRGPEEQGRVH